MTRRTALLGAASAVFLAACGKRPARVIAGNPADIRVLDAALQVEYEQIAFYRVGVRLSKAPILRTILEQEQAHLAAIKEAIRELGGTPAPPGAVAGANIPADFKGWKAAAIAREQQWSAGYAALIPKLANQRLRGTFGALMTTEAEHAVALEVAA